MTGFGQIILSLPLLAVLAGCSGLSVFKDNDKAPSAKVAAPEAPVEAPLAPAPVDPPKRPTLAPDPDMGAPVNAIPAAKVRAAVAGKSFRWTGPNNSGTTLFAQDGTSLIEVDGKGTTSGKWIARDGQLCESINPGPILPKGSPLKCNPFSGSPGNFKVGPATFRPS